MSDPDAAPDPIDRLYTQSEVLLDDSEARIARRARVLAAIEREPAAKPRATSTSQHRVALGRGGWLAAACVAGLGVIFTTHAYHPPMDRPQTAGLTPPTSIPTLAVPARGAPPLPTASNNALTPRRTLRSSAAAVTAGKSSPPEVYRSAPPVMIAPAPNAFPAPPPLAVTALAPPPIQPHFAPPAPINIAPPPPIVLAPTPPAPQAPAPSAAPFAVGSSSFGRVASPALVPTILSQSSTKLQTDQAGRLRAAAAGGRTAEIQALLAQGVSIDAVDKDGDTALMKSIQADHAAAAALLIQHGASLERRNHAGVSAKDMALTTGDPELSRALGLEP